MRKKEEKKKKKKGKKKKKNLKAFAMIKKMNQYISTSTGSTTCKTTYNN